MVYDIKKKTSKLDGLFSSLKNELLNTVSTYIKKNIKLNQEIIQKQISTYIEKQIRKKVKEEIKRLSLKIIIISLLVLGTLFFLYGIISMIVINFNLPSYITPLSYGLFLFLISWILYLFK